MRILFIFNLAVTNPLFLELVHRLQHEGHSVRVYDFISSKTYDPVTGYTTFINSYWWAKWVLKIKYIRRFFIPYINKKCISKEFKHGDIVNVHYVHKEYAFYAKQIKQQGCRLVTTFWGSDYLRASDQQKKAYQKLLKYSDSITMVEGVKRIFENEFPEYKHKTQSTFFGLKLLDLINSVTERDIAEFKTKYNIPLSKRIISIGYNASPLQQHLKLIEAIGNLKSEIKEDVHVFVPLTYGGDTEYKNRLRLELDNVGVTYTVFESKLEEKELALLRCASDIDINIQVSDAFSASLSESIAAGKLLVVGDWLPYDLYDLWEVKLVRTSEGKLPENIKAALSQYDNWEEIGKRNSNVIFNKLSWTACLQTWEKVYKT
ncbi:glycosyltransferase [Pontibacter liquoris]|uniref:glycosyltransferase n=1 Tax=Pontibacter liquoris TaxID=2905677 RepID=UPI001FA73807|nr:glycosyltransferase [Pontibacter liquoris]